MGGNFFEKAGVAVTVEGITFEIDLSPALVEAGKGVFIEGGYFVGPEVYCRQVGHFFGEVRRKSREGVVLKDQRRQLRCRFGEHRPVEALQVRVNQADLFKVVKLRHPMGIGSTNRRVLDVHARQVLGKLVEVPIQTQTVHVLEGEPVELRQRCEELPGKWHAAVISVDYFLQPVFYAMERMVIVFSNIEYGSEGDVGKH